MRNMAYVATSESKLPCQFLGLQRDSQSELLLLASSVLLKSVRPVRVLLCIGRLSLVADAADLML